MVQMLPFSPIWGHRFVTSAGLGIAWPSGPPYQVIVAADLTHCAADAPSLLPMLEMTAANCGKLRGQFLADSGYCAEESLKTLVEMNVDALIATGRWSHGQAPPPAMPFHNLRHSCASLLLAQGVPARVVMETLGHSNISLTLNTYSHVAAELMREAAEAMDRALG